MQLALSGFDAQLDAAACTPADTRRDAKEDLERRPDGQVLASMTLQRFLRGYSQRCGMTGTAQDAASELRAFYGLDIMAVPTHRPLRRVDRLDLVFTHRAAKETAVVEEVVRAHATGRPVLVGTLTVEQTERIAAAMRTRGVACEVLNAKEDEHEAQVVAAADARGAVTIAANRHESRHVDLQLRRYAAVVMPMLLLCWTLVQQLWKRRRAA